MLTLLLSEAKVFLRNRANIVIFIVILPVSVLMIQLCFPDAYSRRMFFSVLLCLFLGLSSSIRAICGNWRPFLRMYEAGLSVGRYVTAQCGLQFLIAFYVATVVSVGLSVFILNAHWLECKLNQVIYGQDTIKEWTKADIPPGADPATAEGDKIIAQVERRKDVANAVESARANRLPPFLIVSPKDKADTSFPLKPDSLFQLVGEVFLIDFRFVSCFLMFAVGSAVGLCLSALFKRPDAAIRTVPFIIIPQILFSKVALESQVMGDGVFDSFNRVLSSWPHAWSAPRLLSLLTFSRYGYALANVRTRIMPSSWPRLSDLLSPLGGCLDFWVLVFSTVLSWVLTCFLLKRRLHRLRTMPSRDV